MNQHPAHKPKPIVWTIAGTDPSGGAGIQADVKTMNGLGVHGCSVITAIIAQNTKGVNAIEHSSPSMLSAQLRALSEDLPPAAVKLGMLANRKTVEVVAHALREHPSFVVCDPVLAASSGKPLLDKEAYETFLRELLPQVDLLTPNLPEASRLLGEDIRGPQDREAAAQAFRNWGAKSVLIKGGHDDGPFAQDYWTDGEEKVWLTLPRLNAYAVHGSGCVLSAAIAACVGRRFDVKDALVIARAYLHRGIRKAPPLGKGRRLLHMGGWPDRPEDLPWMSRTALQGKKRFAFPPIEDGPIGLYPIVDRAHWVEKLHPLGIRTVQLRIKDLDGSRLEEEVTAAIRAARRSGLRLFVNDHWRLAIAHAAYGVHLGQDDLEPADMDAIAAARLRLGISTHSYAELARAHAYRPSYVAIGTVFQSPSKRMDYPPLGIAAFSRMRRVLDVPVVAIGGITLERAPALLAAGANGFAVISEIHDAHDLERRVRGWHELLSAHEGQARG